MDVLVYIECADGKAVGGSFEALAAGASTGASVNAVLIGSGLDDAAASVAACGPAAVTIVDADNVTEDYIVAVLTQLAKDTGATAVFAAATPVGKSITPRIAAKLDAGAVTDATSVAVDGDAFVFTRPTYGGKVIESLKVAFPAIVNIRPGAFEKAGADAAAAPVTHKAVAVADADLKAKLVEVIAEQGESVNLEDSDIIVAGGRGMGTPEDFNAYVGALAEALGGAVGGSRPAAESGWVPKAQQVGQSGKIVAPSLYVAVAISGATQHLAGMSGSKYIVAINKDEEAPMCQLADLAIVGDAKVIIPILAEKIKERKG